MDWNKSNTILIIAFLVVNVFLFGFIYVSDNFTEKYNLEEKEEFLNSVKEILKTKNITITCEIPRKVYKAPFLEIKYDTIHPNEEIIKNFIGDYDGIINDEILFYENEYESIEIVGMKKIIYNNEKAYITEIKNAEFVDNIISDFCNEKKVDASNFIKVNEIDGDDYKLVTFVEKYKGYNIENAYMKFYIKGEKVFRFEMQKVISLNERAQITSISAAEALLRLMAIDSIINKEVTDIQICYYTSEDEDFENINSINVDLVWKVIFSDNTFSYLVAEEY